MIFQNRSELCGQVARRYTARYYKGQGTHKAVGFGKLYPVKQQNAKVISFTFCA
jgi:hypothetical protein